MFSTNWRCSRRAGCGRPSGEEVAALAGAGRRQPGSAEVITPQQVLGLIARSVVERPLPGAIAELAPMMGRIVLASRHNAATRVSDICPRKTFDAGRPGSAA
ncbi:MAG: hypothetical protein IPO66_20075 [Rhodanobacteraceae bacterium]|nr:hypothetical protein [Rhodanobacteraceae bacterium]